VLKRYYALQVLRKHGLCDSSLHTIFRPVAAAKLLYASSALSMPLTANRILHLFTAVSALVFVLQIWQTFMNFTFSADEHLLKKNPSLSSYHRLLHRITILERDNITDNFQTAYHTWLIAILLQECYIMMYINFCLYFTTILLYNCGLTIVIKRICYVTWQLKWLQPWRSDECPQTCTR